MAALVMSLDNMIQNNRRNGVRGIGGGKRKHGVRGPRGMCRGDGRLAGPSCEGPLGVYGPIGAFGGAGRMALPPHGVLLGMYGPGGTCRGAGRLAARHHHGHLHHGHLDMYGTGRTCRGAGRLGGRHHHGHMDMYGPGGTCRSAGRLAGHHRRGSLGTCAVEKTMCDTENSPVQNDVLEDRSKAVGASGVESGAKLQVSNLSDGVSNEDIRELFSEIGELVRYGIHYDKNGSPCGSAEVVFARRSDAFQAVEKYNNTQFHGKPMKIENLGSIIRAHVASRLNITGGANGRRPRPRHMRTIAILDHGAGSFNHGRTCGVHIRRRGGRGRVHGGQGERPEENLAEERGVHIRRRGGRVHGGQGERPEEKSVEEPEKELENDQAGTSQIEEQEE